MKVRNQKWYEDRIGKVIFIDKPVCPCNKCKEYFKKGYSNTNKEDSLMNWTYFSELGLIAFDSKEERDAFNKKS